MPTNYVSRDFSSIKSDLVGRARATIPEWSSSTSPDFVMLLIDLWAYMGDIQNYYIDRAHTESYLDTATQSASVRALARMMGYQPNSRTAASATVTVSNSSGAAIVVPKGTIFVVPATSSKAAVYFTSSAAATANAGASVAISVNEGREVTETLASNFSGESGAAVRLSEKKAVPSSLSITVGTTTYSHTTRMFDVGADAPSFMSLVDSEDFTRVVLGNGVNGRVPPAGSTVKVTYRVGQGSLGNVAVNAISTMDSPVLHLTVASSTVASGGTDAESNASIKKNAPALRRVQDRAVTLTDYTTLMKGFAGVTKAVAVSSVSSGLVTVKYAALPTYAGYANMDSGTSTLYLTPAAGTPNFGTPGEDIHANMTAYLQDRSMIGVTVSPISTTINLTTVYVAFNSVQVADGYYQEAVKTAIDAAVRGLFTWDAVDFNTTIRLSSVLSAAQSVSGVKSVFISNLGSSSSGSSVADHTPTATTASTVSLPVLRTITFTGVSGGIS